MYRIQDLHNPTDTLFTNIKRLMPAHIGTVQSDKLDIQQYWQLEPKKEIKLHPENLSASLFMHFSCIICERKFTCKAFIYSGFKTLFASFICSISPLPFTCLKHKNEFKLSYFSGFSK